MSVYLNSASHGLPSDATLARMEAHLSLERAVGPDVARARVQDEFSAVREKAARLIGAAPGDLGFNTTTKAAWLPMVIKLPLRGRRVLIAPHEWGENIRFLQDLAALTGAEVERLPEIDFAAPDLAPWAARIDTDVAAICVPMVTSVHGHLYPIAEIGALPRPEGCMFIVDAAQALGQVPVDVGALGCDVLVATCRKWLRGPRSSALFWRRPDLADRFVITHLEPSDAHVAVRLGLGVALEECLDRGVAEIRAQLLALRAFGSERAQALGLRVLADHPAVTGALCLGVPAERADALDNHLNRNGFAVRFPDVGWDEVAAPKLPAELRAMRVSPHVFNTEDEIAAFMDCVAEGL